jgi:hypothetical protein
MTITINNTRSINGGDDSQKWIEISVTADGDDCKFTHVAPDDLSGDDLQTYVDDREEFYKKEVLRNMYKDADTYDSPLEDFEAWIAAGCKNAEVKGEDHEGNEYVITPETVIEKTAWVDSH